MNREELKKSISQIDQEKSRPTIYTVDKCITVLDNYFLATEEEKPEFLEKNRLSEYHKLNKRRIDHLTWRFSQLIFDEVSRKRDQKKENLEIVVKGYQSLAKLNGIDLEDEEVTGNIDFIHIGENFSLFTRLRELSSQLGEKEEAEIYQRKEKKRKEKIEESERLFREGIREHRNWQVKEAIKKYRQSLDINHYNTKARVMLGFTYSTTIILNQLFKEPNKEMFYYSEEEFGGIPLWEVEEYEEEKGRFKINLGANFQKKYYLKPEPEELEIIFTCVKFAESNNKVFRYVRDFSEELSGFMAAHSPILRRSAFKFYKESEEKKDKKRRDLCNMEIKGLDYFSKVKKIKIPEKVREPQREDEPHFLELRLIEGQSMYNFLRVLERSSYDIIFKEKIRNALIDKHIEDLVTIQAQTSKMGEEGLDFETSDYQSKLENAFNEKPNITENKGGGLTFLLEKYFKLKVEYPPVLDELGRKINEIVGKKKIENSLVIYKDSSPRNTIIDLKRVLSDLGLADEFERKYDDKAYHKAEKVIPFLFNEYSNNQMFNGEKEVFLRKMDQQFRDNLYQLDFEKIYRLSSEFDDLLECIEFPFFYPGKSEEEKNKREEKWEDKYKLFLSLKNKENKAEELKEEYFLFSVNRSIRWLYYLMGWFERSEGKDKQHLEDMQTHLGNTYRAMDWLEEYGKQNPKSTAAEFKFRGLREVIQSIKGGNETKLAQWKW